MNARDTTPTARDWLLNYAGDSDWRTQVDRVLTQHRTEVLAEAGDAARSKRLPVALYAGDIGYNQGVADAVAAIGALAQGVVAEAPDPIAYGPRGYRCGCGKDAHSNLVPCAPDQSDVDAEQAAQRSVDAQFPVVAAFVTERGESR
ncbi:hypothetical protein ACLF6K_37150 [Streptomyces xanthophaeus]|uniref:hypothetical protein n=1 Tax=Streptomyces xanthophaeus TaxID=67385 RepID=UPI00398FCEAC